MTTEEEEPFIITHPLPKIFILIRQGRNVGHGVEFQDKTCVVHWLGKYQSTVVWKSYEDLVAVNGQNGHTKFQFIN